RNIQVDQSDLQILGPDAVAFNGTGQPGYDIPQDLFDAVGQGGADADVNVTDPDFEIPSEWKFSLGGTYITETDYVFNIDYLYTDKQDSAIFKNISYDQTGTAPDGRPIYNGGSDFLLTNVEGDDAYSHVLSLAMNKSFDNGIDLALSYAYTVSKDVSPMTSSVAFSNYHYVAVSDSENPGVATSNYEIPHRFTMSLGYSHELFDGYETKFNLFGQAQQTSPYSYGFDNSTYDLGYNDAARQLLYVPTLDDSKVVYGADFDQAAFNEWVESEGLTRGKINSRNSIDGDWWVTFDFKVEQEFMGFGDGQKGSAYFVIKNIGNMLNDDWGVLKSGSSLQSAVTTEIVNGQYVYTNFNDPVGASVDVKPSLWEMRVGVKYTF
ncbi:MAG: TonB-dependent receptor, partial [Pseudoalteromonas sp.]